MQTKGVILWSSEGLTSRFQHCFVKLHSCTAGGMHRSIIMWTWLPNRHTNNTAHWRTNRNIDILFSDTVHTVILHKTRLWIGRILELVESLLVSLKHVPYVEVQGVGCVPVLQLCEVGVLCESHDVQRGVLCCVLLAWQSMTEQIIGKAFWRASRPDRLMPLLRETHYTHVTPPHCPGGLQCMSTRGVTGTATQTVWLFIFTKVLIVNPSEIHTVAVYIKNNNCTVHYHCITDGSVLKLLNNVRYIDTCILIKVHPKTRTIKLQ